MQITKSHIRTIYAVTAIGMTLISCGDDDSPENRTPEIEDQIFNITEDAALNKEVGTVKATDDGELTFTITAGNTGDVFAIDEGSGQITVVKALNFETKDTYTLTIQVQDPEKLTSNAEVTVTVTDVNEAPMFASAKYTQDVPENTAVDGDVVTVSATDEDGGDMLNHTITAGNTGDVFAIDGNTGQITVAKALDFETKDTYILTVQVQDPEKLTSNAEVTVKVIDVNEAPMFASAKYTQDVPENTAIDGDVVTVSATDKDGGDMLNHTITAGNTGDVFAIDGSTGQITVAKALTGKGGITYNLTVRATDNDNATPLSAEVMVTINVTDVEEAPMPPAIADQTFSVVENAATGARVGRIATSDADGFPKFSITAGNEAGAFRINELLGTITVASSAPLDFETTPTFNLTVGISNGTATRFATITIELIDSQELTIAGTTFNLLDGLIHDGGNFNPFPPNRGSNDLTSHRKYTFKITSGQVQTGAFGVGLGSGRPPVFQLWVPLHSAGGDAFRPGTFPYKYVFEVTKDDVAGQSFSTALEIWAGDKGFRAGGTIIVTENYPRNYTLSFNILIVEYEFGGSLFGLGDIVEGGIRKNIEFTYTGDFKVR
ncbi:MAG: cadherin repeat domain-containing protein [Ekhidna sp.]|nr:cadherin repeat domain-containing protein [Ekhidna sp.]